MLGPDQPVILHMLDIEPAAQALQGVRMELLDAAYPLLAGQEPGLASCPDRAPRSGHRPHHSARGRHCAACHVPTALRPARRPRP